MTEQQIAALGPGLVAFLGRFRRCFVRRPTFDHFLTYCRSLMGELPRKSVEPIALANGVPVRTLQEFLADHRWGHDQMRDLLQQEVAQRMLPAPGVARGPDELVIGLIDETGHLKKGDKTPGVQRQYSGAAGKIDNCILTVHLGVACGDFQTLLDRDLYLPQSWAADRSRCRQASIPDDLTHQTKWQLAQGQVERAIANGVRLDFLTFDEEYGKVPEFLFNLEHKGQVYVAEAPPHATAWGRRPACRSNRLEHAPSELRHLVRWGHAFIYQDWQDVQIQRRTDAPQTWRVKAAQVWRVKTGRGDRRRPTDRTYWLIHAWQPETHESKYFLSNAPPTTPLKTLLEVAFSRARVEHLFRIAKSELGLHHFEGRSYIGLLRHMTLCMLTMLFVAEHTTRLRGGKSAGHHGAGLPRAGRPVPPLA